MKTTFICAALVVATLAAGCDKQDADRANAQARSAGAKLEGAAERAKEKLSEAAKKTEAAVSDSTDKLKPKVENATSEMKPKLEAAGDKLQAAAKETGDKISSAASSAETSDAAITAAIKAKYVAEPSLSALKIEVDANGGVVTLNGLAKDAAARTRAEEIARATKGVGSVKNHLTLKQG